MFQILHFSPVVLRIWGVPRAAAAEELGEVSLISLVWLGEPCEGSTSQNSNLHPALATLLPQLPADPTKDLLCEPRTEQDPSKVRVPISIQSGPN